MKSVSGYQVKTYNGSTFVRVFHQSTVINHGSSMFFKDRDIIFYNKPYKFSVMGSINERFKNNGYYEFLINYPDGSKVHWRQMTNPLEYTNETGMQPIDINNSVFQGLRRVNSTKTCIKGTDYLTYWYFAIGTKEIYKEGIPGFCWNQNDNNVYKEVTLWMKIDNESVIYTSLPPLYMFSNARKACRMLAESLSIY